MDRLDDFAIIRRLARDHWVRLHGTPRVTVLVGGDEARRCWIHWAELGKLDATLLDGTSDFDAAMRDATARAVAEPSHPIAIVTGAATFERWHGRTSDRLRALADEGVLVVDGREASAGDGHRDARGEAAVRFEPQAEEQVQTRPDDRLASIDARSAAEAVLFEALEQAPSTRGRFVLNARLSVRFGGDAAEVDLLSRQDAIAIEIDGYHHFTDAERYRRDRRKDVLLQAQGLFVIRLLADDVMRDARQAVKVVYQALAYRRGSDSDER